jgi:hypothetical protein
MARLTKNQARLHRQARELAGLGRDLTEEEREFVLDHWQEAETAAHGLDGAYFTPAGLAGDFRIEVTGERIIDLCAGIGRLSYHSRDLWIRRWEGLAPREMVCVERNPEYVAVGRKVLPEATWIEADIFDLPPGLGEFDCAIGNPPFGAVTRSANGGRYTGRRFEYHAIALAAQLARRGVFIVPAQSAPFRLSGRPYVRQCDDECARFQRETGITIKANCGIDTSVHADDWRGVAPEVEIIICDFAQDPGSLDRI